MGQLRYLSVQKKNNKKLTDYNDLKKNKKKHGIECDFQSNIPKTNPILSLLSWLRMNVKNQQRRISILSLLEKRMSVSVFWHFLFY